MARLKPVRLFNGRGLVFSVRLVFVGVIAERGGREAEAFEWSECCDPDGLFGGIDDGLALLGVIDVERKGEILINLFRISCS